MKQFRKLKFFFLLIHLAVIFAGIVPSNKYPPNFIQYFLMPYARLTGAGASFGFFSPNVGNQITIKFYNIEDNGDSKEIQIKNYLSQEAHVRVGNMFRVLGQTYNDQAKRRSILASFASFIFNQDDSIQRLRAVVSLYEVPSLSQLPLGHKVVERPLYEVTFRR